MRPYLLFFAMLVGGLVTTAILGSTLDARLIDQEQRRELAFNSD